MDHLIVDKPSKILRAYFLGTGQSTLFLPSSANPSPAWSCYVNFLPDTPDSAVSINDTAGTLHGKLMRTGEGMRHYGIQIRVRALDDDVAYQHAILLVKILDQIKMGVATVGSLQYIILNAAKTSQPIAMGIDKDDQRRRMNYSINTLMKIIFKPIP